MGHRKPVMACQKNQWTTSAEFDGYFRSICGVLIFLYEKFLRIFSVRQNNGFLKKRLCIWFLANILYRDFSDVIAPKAWFTYSRNLPATAAGTCTAGCLRQDVHKYILLPVTMPVAKYSLLNLHCCCCFQLFSRGKHCRNMASALTGNFC